jgi:hypothetical protein
MQKRQCALVGMPIEVHRGPHRGLSAVCALVEDAKLDWG